jgi:hypothetical protein
VRIPSRSIRWGFLLSSSLLGNSSLSLIFLFRRQCHVFIVAVLRCCGVLRYLRYCAVLDAYCSIIAEQSPLSDSQLIESDCQTPGLTPLTDCHLLRSPVFLLDRIHRSPTLTHSPESRSLLRYSLDFPLTLPWKPQYRRGPDPHSLSIPLLRLSSSYLTPTLSSSPRIADFALTSNPHSLVNLESRFSSTISNPDLALTSNQGSLRIPNFTHLLCRYTTFLSATLRSRLASNPGPSPNRILTPPRGVY